MILIREIDGNWAFDVASFDAPLQARLAIEVDASGVQFRPQSKRTPRGALSCELVSWKYVIKGSEQTTLELSVRERQEPWLDRILRTDERRFNFAVCLAIASAAVAIIGYLFARYDPLDTWAFAGRHARMFGGWGLFVVIAFLLPGKLGLYKREVRVKQVFLTSLFLYAGIGLGCAWASIARLPTIKFDYSNQAYASYAQSLWEKVSANYWPVIALALPWLLVASKLFGLDVSEKTSGAVLDVLKKKESA